MSIVSMLEEQVGRRSDAVAILEGVGARSRATTFGDLDRRAKQGAALLRSCGLGPGDRILLFHRMSLELYVALVSALRVGMVAVFVEPSAGLGAIDRCCARARPAAFVGGPKAHLLRAVVPAVWRIPIHFCIGSRVPGAVPWSRADRLAVDPAIEPVDEDSPALLTLTSGSTGAPKAAVRTHRFLRAQYDALQAVLDLRAGEVDLTSLPIVMLANLASGLTSVIPDADLRFPGSIDAAPVLAQMDELGVTRAGASPAFLERLVDHCERTGRRTGRLEKIFTGGGPVFPSLLERLHHVAPSADITSVYGSSEAEPIATIAYRQLNDADREAMTGGSGLLAGKPVSTLQLRILSETEVTPLGRYSHSEFVRLSMPPGRAGEIVVSGAHVLSGYLNGDGDIGTKFRVEDTIWHRTGDSGVLDLNGRLWLLGRRSARIDDGRGILYPFAVECAAQQHSSVGRAALIGADGERILAVEMRRAMDNHELSALKQSLSWAGIDQIRVYPRLPVDRRHNTKIDYGALQKLIERRNAAMIV